MPKEKAKAWYQKEQTLDKMFQEVEENEKFSQFVKTCLFSDPTPF